MGIRLTRSEANKREGVLTVNRAFVREESVKMMPGFSARMASYFGLAPKQAMIPCASEP